jgi:predicted aconitase with swiveling domain
MKLQGRAIYHGQVSGETLVSNMDISFFGGVDPETGVVVEKGHDLEGRSIAGKVLVFPSGKGSTVGSYSLYRMAKNGKAPAAIVNAECETIIAVGCIIAEIPCIDHISIDEIQVGWVAYVDGDSGTINLDGQSLNLN